MSAKTISLDEVKTELLADPAIQQAYAALAPAQQVTRLRIARGLIRRHLRELVGTRQPSIARLESGAMQPSISFLRKVAAALDAQVEVTLVPRQQPS